jgi:hypothetical protein
VKTAVAWYCIVVGVLLAVVWANELRWGAWNRGDRTHGEPGLHLAGEFVTAGLLIASGAAWLITGFGSANALMAAGLGMLLYTVIVSPGYYRHGANCRQWACSAFSSRSRPSHSELPSRSWRQHEWREGSVLDG